MLCLYRASRLDCLEYFFGFFKNVGVPFINGIERELHRHEIDGHLIDTIDLGYLILYFRGAVSAETSLEFIHSFHCNIPSTPLLADMRETLREHGVDMVVGERVNDLLAVFAKLHEARLLEAAQLV